MVRPSALLGTGRGREPANGAFYGGERPPKVGADELGEDLRDGRDVNICHLDGLDGYEVSRTVYS